MPPDRAPDPCDNVYTLEEARKRVELARALRRPVKRFPSVAEPHRIPLVTPGGTLR